MPPPTFQSRRTEYLRRGRVSLPSAIYFLTWCTANRAPLLTKPALLASAKKTLTSIDPSADGTLLAATIMPDHIHILLQLGTRLSVGQIVGKIKANLTRVRAGIKWQENFFEHHIRTGDDRESFAFYIFMNPYSAKLCSLDESWPGWISGSTIQWTFETKARPGVLPQPEWLEQADHFGTTLPPSAG